MLIENAWAQDTAAGGMAGQVFGFLPIILVFVIVYFLMIRPQAQEGKRVAALQKGLKKGDKVVSIAGILGEVVEVSESAVVLRVSHGDEVVMLKDAVLRAQTEAEEKIFKKTTGKR